MSRKPNTTSPSLSNKRPGWRPALTPYGLEIKAYVSLRHMDLADQGLQNLAAALGETLWQEMRMKSLEVWTLTDYIEGEMQERGVK